VTADEFSVGQRVRIRTTASSYADRRAVDGRNGIVESNALYSDDTANADGPWLGVWVRERPGQDGRVLYIFEPAEVEPR
jgi:hypothetical protein